MRPSELVASIFLFSSACAASGAAWAPIEAFENDIAPILRRQGDQSTSYDLSFSAKQGNTATTESDAKATGDATTTGDSNDATATSDGDSSRTSESGDKTTGTAKNTGTAKSSNKSGSQTTKTFDARLPAGGVSMITPNAQSTSYYKIKDYITFAWNYTSLSVTPSRVDILASCSKNQETYTIALNQSVQETQSVIWDTGAFQASATVPLLTETYTLIIHDAAKDVSDTPQAGYLATYNQFTFGMYSPQPYTPMSEYVCATCNSAMSLAEKQTLIGLLSLAGITVLTFGWFTGVAGLW
ncbi:hypothetical protein AC579_6455 [Pseudocercospora musae]|uniref:DUF7137 domain-containing protein n=1 Tax=Pseudocercospora musae TaxID=113226 RepID=A0A139IKK8_9PEZI|nr:hypothetical protein AC579_6455 [Pseudocercospora musae]